MRIVLVLAATLLAGCAPTGRRTIAAEGAPKAIGNLVEGDIQAQTERVLRNLEAVLAAAGLSMAHVVKTTVYMVDLAEFPRMNETYGKWFPRDPPARATVQVAALPKGARIEIEAVARR
jgi:2-iminobutanoate/2-iminopropanoate deaminase